MSDCYEQEREISLVDIFALCIRKFFVLACCAVVGAAIAVGVHICSVNKKYNPVAVEEQLIAKRVELEKMKSVKALEYKLTLNPYMGAVSTTDFNKAVSLFTSMDKSISSLEVELSTLEQVEQTGKKPYLFAKYAVIGFLAGGFVSLMCIVIAFISSEPVTSSEDSKHRLKSPLLGALFTDNCGLEKLARKALGEVCWADKTTALRWFEENLDSTVLPDKAKVAVLYSGNNTKAVEASKEIIAVMNKKGYEVSFTENAALNPETNSRVQACDVVLLFEKQWTSKWKDVCADVEIAQRFEKNIAGFVLC